MKSRHIIIIGGGLAGLSAGCYALRSGYRTTIVEHNLALGGVCTSWHRGLYTVDGCIHWLTGGPFEQLYHELEIVPEVPLRTLDTWVTYRDVRDGIEVPFTRDLGALMARLRGLSPDDADELARLRHGIEALSVTPPIEAPELGSLRDALRALWEMRDAIGPFVHFRKPVGVWAREHFVSPRLRRIFTRLFPETAPALFVLLVLGYLQRGYLSRPVGGTAAFRGALERTYRSLGGEVILPATADEVLTTDGAVRGVRLADGTMMSGDLVISTASTPETILRLLGGRYEAEATHERLAHWKLFDPVVLVSYGVAHSYADMPTLLVLDGVPPVDTGGRAADSLYLRVCNDDASFAPPGHSVVQAMLPSDYAWWATRGAHYGAEKEALGERLIDQLEPHFPGLRAGVRMMDVATPLTYWGMARAWRGAYEGWMPNADALFGHLKKKLHGLSGFYMAGQWLEPGGGVPMAVMSGRQAIQLICHDDERPFIATKASGTGASQRR